MCEECTEAIDIQNELSAKYGKITPEKLWAILSSKVMMDYTLKTGRLWEILMNCPNTPDWLGKEGAYRLATLTDMKNSNHR